ncbi:MAG: CDP-alcohol phosphatidyltransferase family protein [Pseudomonadota bacterium]
MSNYNALLYVPSDTPEAMVMSTIKVAGVPLIVRGIMNLYNAGFRNVTLLIASTQQRKISRALERYRKERLPQVNYIYYDESYSVNPDIVQKLTDALGDQPILINANLLFDKETITPIKEKSINNNEIIRCQEGAHHVPIVKVSIQNFSKLKEFTAARPRSIASCLNFLKEHSVLTTVIQKPEHANTFLVRRPRERLVAEKFLAEAIRLATNGPVAKYLNKRISLPISLVMSRLWISPHAITAVNIVIGLLSGVFMAGKDYYSLLIGAILFQTASVADGVDGEVSKLTFRCSKFGQFIDTISDNLALASCLIGLTIGTSRIYSPLTTYVLGILAIFNAAFCIFLMAGYLKKNTNSASLATFNKNFLNHLSSTTNPSLVWFINHFKYFIMKDGFAFLIFVFGLSGFLPAFLFLITFGTCLAAGILFYLLVLQPKSNVQAKANLVSDKP